MSDYSRYRINETVYYQMLIETIKEDGKRKPIYMIDIENKDKIINGILIPYLSGEEFIVDGYILTKPDVSRLKIVRTDPSANQWSDKRNRTMPERILYYVKPEDIIGDTYSIDVTADLIAEAKQNLDVGCEKVRTGKNLDRIKVFIVHGRDNAVKNEVARFVESLDLEAIILSEQASGGSTIIEKIENYSDVGFGIVLYAPCDEGYKKDEPENKKFRARQNVVFEHGYLIGKLGRNNVCALIAGDVEIPNDISGMVYIPFDDNEGWKLSVAKEMYKLGYEIHLNNLVGFCKK